MASSEGNITCEGNIVGEPDRNYPARAMRLPVTSEGNITCEGNIKG